MTQLTVTVADAQRRFDELLGLAAAGTRVLIKSDSGSLVQLKPIIGESEPKAP